MNEFENILDKAHNAATQAILDMYKEGKREQPFNCGFAWVTIDGNDALARFCRKTHPDTPAVRRNSERSMDRFYGSKGEPGWRWWKPGEWPSMAKLVGAEVDMSTVGGLYQQDMDFHVAAATAFQKVLADHGIRANVGSRLD
jgi:hypothetical protein